MENSISLRRTTQNNPTKCPSFYIYTPILFLLVFTFQSLAIQNTPTTPPDLSPNSTSSTHLLNFHPLKDPTVPPYTNPNRTWFMSTLTGCSTDGMPEHFIFPSRHPPNDKILCLHTGNKSYTLADADIGFPIAEGLTFIADSFYDYENIWHGLNAIAPFFSWMQENGFQQPKRWVLFKNGDRVHKVGNWVHNVMNAVLGEKVAVDGLDGHDGMVCFERAVVFRRGLGGMDGRKRNRLFELVRWKAWSYCGVGDVDEGNDRMRISLVVREGKRGFKNESGVRKVMERECLKMKGCTLRVVHFHNLSFCDQVRTMRNTDIFTSTHGAQLTNMVFMPKGSSVMEMFPTGWLEGAGVGQFIYQWFASWSEMRYEGAWRDTEGFDCTKSSVPRSKCFSVQKDQQVGINETYLSSWIGEVIRGSLGRKGKNA